jgi:flagellar biosynthetic protein FliQ
MSQEIILKLAKDTLQLTLMISAPMLIISLAIGLIISVVQVVTSIQDQTLSFVPRVIAVFLAFLIALPWAMKLLLAFSAQLFGHLERFAR